MTKYIDLDSEEQEKVGDLLESRAVELGLDKWESQSGAIGSLESKLGICSNCKTLRYCKTEFGDVIAHCWTFKINLHGRDRVVECNEHNARGIMSLRDMEMMATLIDIGEGEIGGFITSNPRLRKKK